MIRFAKETDLPAVAAIYEAILDLRTPPAPTTPAGSGAPTPPPTPPGAFSRPGRCM